MINCIKPSVDFFDLVTQESKFLIVPSLISAISFSSDLDLSLYAEARAWGLVAPAFGPDPCGDLLVAI